MLPVPLQWAIGTLTVWHGIILAGFVALSLLVRTKSEQQLPLPMRVWASFVTPVTFYAMFALIAGQVFGDHFPWAMLWPAGLWLGALFASMFLATLLGDAGLLRARKAGPILTLAVGTPVAAGFFGLFFAVAWWIFPRVIALGGLIDFPDLAWAVHLYRGP
jgi:hypothetical protein